MTGPDNAPSPKNTQDPPVSEISFETPEYTLHSRIPLSLSIENLLSPLQRFLGFQNDGRLTRLLIERNLRFATMESCTCGLIASNITDYEGASAILTGSAITYSNEAKVQAGVDPAVIRTFGVYSPETARAMAHAARHTYGSAVTLGITGSFGNTDPANADSVAGEIYFHLITGCESSYHLLWHDLTLPRREMKRRTAELAQAVVYTALTEPALR